MCDHSPKYALQKALVVTRTPTILGSVVEVNIGKSTDPDKYVRGRYKVPYLLTPTLFTLVNAIPAMRQLHTIQLNSIILSRMYLYTILSSPCLIHLILNNVRLPKIRTFPPTKLRKLTLTMMFSWETVNPLISQLATSLEYLELKWCEFLSPSQLQLPSFPCLLELRHHQCHGGRTFLDKSQVNDLLRLGSQVTHLYVTGHYDNEPVTTCPESLQYLSTSIWMLSEHIFGTEPFPRLVALNVLFSEHVDVNHPVTPSSFIRDHFPTITSLYLYMPWAFRNRAMVMARSQRNVQTLKLSIYMHDGIMDEELVPYFPAEAPLDQLHRAMLPSALQILQLEVDQCQYHDELERNASRCTQWVFDDVVSPVTSLGGTGLKSIVLSVLQPKSRSVEREQVLSRQWVKLPDGDWQRLE
jgi:hypothetical protein